MRDLISEAGTLAKISHLIHALAWACSARLPGWSGLTTSYVNTSKLI